METGLISSNTSGLSMNRDQDKHQVYVCFVKYHIGRICASAPPVRNLSRGSLEDGRRSFNMCYSGALCRVTIMEDKIYDPALKKFVLQATSPMGLITAPIPGSALWIH